MFWVWVAFSLDAFSVCGLEALEQTYPLSKVKATAC
jgi:hypothetical protein